MRINQNNQARRVHSKEINIRDFFVTVKKRLWIVALITILSSLAGYYFSNTNNTLLYQTSTRILIDSDSGYMKTLMVMIKDPLILEKVKENLNLSRPAERIASQLEVAQIDDSQVIMITVTDQDPKLAVAIANETASTYKNEVGSILDFDEVQLLSQAKENNNPINESSNRLFIIAIVFGLVTGVGLAFLLDSLDGTVRDHNEVEDILGVPVIGVVSKMKIKRVSSGSKKKKKKEVIVRGDTVDIK